jgi:hypothetical protein
VGKASKPGVIPIIGIRTSWGVAGESNSGGSRFEERGGVLRVSIRKRGLSGRACSRRSEGGPGASMFRGETCYRRVVSRRRMRFWIGEHHWGKRAV